eukprot:13904482-Alexandrium_andersonii.AAC.1
MGLTGAVKRGISELELVAAHLQAPALALTVVAAYRHHGDASDWWAAFAEFLRELGDRRPVIVYGDFNVDLGADGWVQAFRAIGLHRLVAG